LIFTANTGSDSSSFNAYAVPLDGSSTVAITPLGLKKSLRQRDLFFSRFKTTFLYDFADRPRHFRESQESDFYLEASRKSSLKGDLDFFSSCYRCFVLRLSS